MDKIIKEGVIKKIANAPILKKERKSQSATKIIDRPVGGALRLAWYRGNAPTTGRSLALAQSLDIATW